MNQDKRISQSKIKLEWIPVRNLAVIWPDAQRPFKEWWAKEIAEKFDPDMLQPVKTMMPNGHGIHHICDGQHTVAAVRLCLGHDQLVPCLVADESNPKRAADIFLQTNTGRSAVGRVNTFKVAVTAQYQEETAIDRIVRHCGYRVEMSKTQDTIAAVDALKFVYGKGARTLDKTLGLIRDTWGGDPTAVSSPILKSYGAFICEFQEAIDYSRLRDVMRKKFTPGKLVNDIKGVKGLLKVTGTAAGVHLLMQSYNKGLAANKQLKRKGSK